MKIAATTVNIAATTEQTKQHKIQADKEVRIATIEKEKKAEDTRQLQLKLDIEKEHTEQEKIKKAKPIDLAQEERKNTEALAKIAVAETQKAQAELQLHTIRERNIEQKGSKSSKVMGDVSEQEPDPACGKKRQLPKTPGR